MASSTVRADPSLDISIPATVANDDEVESPSLSSSTALARFEFESGRSNEGTKVLLVEWDDDDTTRHTPGEWHISWKDRESVLPADDQRQNDIHRLYFLLPHKTPVPPQVTLTYVPTDSSRPKVTWKTNPLPAIFPPELGATARAAGKKGVLHTLWAKRRLQALQAEIDAESKNNAEGIGLEIALQEKQWIEDNFGVVTKFPAAAKLLPDDASGRPMSPSTPRTPASGRFLEKLAGLKLGTNDRDLTAANEGPEMLPLTSPQNPLSPDLNDVAVSSYASIKGVDPKRMAGSPPQPKRSGQANRENIQRAQLPSFLTQSQKDSAVSLAGVLNGSANSQINDPDDKDDDLFALPINPSNRGPFLFESTKIKNNS